MRIIHTEPPDGWAHPELKVGEVAKHFASERYWRRNFRSIVVRACIAVDENGALKDQNRGDILYAALVHCIDQIVDVVVQQHEPLNARAEINLWYPMRDTGVWKSNAQLGGIVALAVEILKLYADIELPDPHLGTKVLTDFEEIWRHMIDPVFESGSQSRMIRQFRGGGWLRKILLGADMYERMTRIRKAKKEADEQGKGQV